MHILKVIGIFAVHDFTQKAHILNIKLSLKAQLNKKISPLVIDSGPYEKLGGDSSGFGIQHSRH